MYEQKTIDQFVDEVMYAEDGAAKEKALEKMKQYLFSVYAVDNHPKAERVWELAWEHGHGCNLNDVAFYFDQFVGLIS